MSALGPTAKILIVGPSWVGDMVMAQSLFLALKAQNPSCQIDVLAPAWSLGLLQRMPEVRQALVMPLGHGEFGWQARNALGIQLRAAQYIQAIVLPNSWKSALVPWFANIPLRTGFLGECRWGLLNDWRKLDKQRLPMTVQRFVALANVQALNHAPSYAQPALKITSAQQQQVIAKFQLVTDKEIVALCPGAEYGPAKQWPAAHFAAVAAEQLQAGKAVWLLGSAKDREIAAEINQACAGQCVDFTGTTTLTEAIDLLSLARVVVSNDSGLMHVAAALDKKVIALYGSSDPHFTPPLHADAKVISLNLTCSPCFKRHCPLGHTHCLTKLTPASILRYLY